jgi:hypothetical protein
LQSCGPWGGGAGHPWPEPCAPPARCPPCAYAQHYFALILYYRVLLLHGSGAEDTHAAPSAAIPEQQQQAGSRLAAGTRRLRLPRPLPIQWNRRRPCWMQARVLTISWTRCRHCKTWYVDISPPPPTPTPLRAPHVPCVPCTMSPLTSCIFGVIPPLHRSSSSMSAMRTQCSSL